MSHEHKDILFEGRDTQDKTIFIWGIGLFAVMIGASMLMIPLVSYFWNASKTTNPIAGEQHTTTPPVILEVLPNHDLKAVQQEIKNNHSQQKIDAAVKAALDEGYPVRNAS